MFAAVTPGTSGILAATLSLLLMAGLQIFKGYLVTSRLSIIFTGFLGSVLFLFILTAISNFEMATFGNHFQAKFKEGKLDLLISGFCCRSFADFFLFFLVTISMLITLFVVGLVHRVAVTTW